MKSSMNRLDSTCSIMQDIPQFGLSRMTGKGAGHVDHDETITSSAGLRRGGVFRPKPSTNCSWIVLNSLGEVVVQNQPGEPLEMGLQALDFERRFAGQGGGRRGLGLPCATCARA